jgi:hypothetical protein
MQVRDLDFDALIDQVIRATDTTRGTSADSIIRDALERTARPDRVALLCSKLAVAAIRGVDDPATLDVSSPLVEAFVRTQRHVKAPPVPFSRIDLENGTDAAPRLSQLVKSHPELGWDIDHVQRLLVESVRSLAGDREVDVRQPPWLMIWGKASTAAHTLWTFVTLRALGDLDSRLRR